MMTKIKLPQRMYSTRIKIGGILNRFFFFEGSRKVMFDNSHMIVDVDRNNSVVIVEKNVHTVINVYKDTNGKSEVTFKKIN
jgi:hypothetical protein